MNEVIHDEMKSNQFKKNSLARKLSKITAIITGLAALIWFLIRVIPKPSRAAYPCQRAAFPLASAFVIWLTGTMISMIAMARLSKVLAKYRVAVVLCVFISIVILIGWFTVIPIGIGETFGVGAADTTFVPAVGFDWKPGASNKPIGVAQGIYPGRVVMSRNSQATKWAGNWKMKEDQWWLDKNTDVDKVNEILSVTLQKLTGTKKDKEAWDKIFKYYNENRRGLARKGYHPGEIVAVKINLNNSSPAKDDNQSDATPQMVLAMVRQLVNNANVPQNDIIVYDARRPMFPAMLTSVWKEFKDIRFSAGKTCY